MKHMYRPFLVLFVSCLKKNKKRKQNEFAVERVRESEKRMEEHAETKKKLTKECEKLVVTKGRKTFSLFVDFDKENAKNA